MKVCFGEFVLDRSTRQLLQAGVARHLEPKAFELLDLLLGRRPEAVSKTEIHDHLWPQTFVSESSLTDLVAQVRHALGDTPQQARFIRTVHGFGYAFSAAASPEDSAPAGQRDPAPRIVWDQRVIALAAGDNLIGRDEEVAVRIDAPGISRRHARIVVSGSQVTIEDLGSKNGTYMHGHRLQAPTALRDGDKFRLGRTSLVFRSAPEMGATRTDADE